jgi:CHASE2 domain-containing sensor protein
MSKLLETALEIAQEFAKKYLPPIFSLIQKVLDLKAFSLSFFAHYSRRFGFRAIILTGVFASLYAGYLFVADTSAPGASKASHDVILKTRFSSPKPSSNIIILDIDERTLASLSEKHGRWPWSRDVLADGVQKVMDSGARAVMFNVMLSDPDKNNQDADAAMDVTAQMNPPIAFPLIRLNPQNDAQSVLKVMQIRGATLADQHQADTTIAVILPMFGSMHDRLGIANQLPDSDGIVRKYPLRWEEKTYLLPSMVQRTAELGGAQLNGTPNVMSLNWRNKQGRYQRFSFSDLLLDQLKPDQVAHFKNAYIVLSLSAPGLGQTKPTSVQSIEDDGEILATALDDAIQQTYLRITPSWVVLLLDLVIIWALVWLSIRPFKKIWFNRLFIGVQSGLGGITLISASYTNYMIDLSDSMSFGLSVFAIIKLIRSMDDRWSRAKIGFRKNFINSEKTDVLILSYLEDKLGEFNGGALQLELEKIVGLNYLIRIDDLFSGESFLSSPVKKVKFLLVGLMCKNHSAVQLILEKDEYVLVNQVMYSPIHQWNPEDKKFGIEISGLVLESGARLLQADLHKSQ